MKMKKRTLLKTLISFAFVGATTAVFAVNGVSAAVPLATATDVEQVSYVQESNTSQGFNVVKLEEWWSFGSAPPAETSLTVEEAAQIAVNALEKIFNENLEGVTVYMSYVARQEEAIIENPYYYRPASTVVFFNNGMHGNYDPPRYIELPERSSWWIGRILPPDGDIHGGSDPNDPRIRLCAERFTFNLNGETGELLHVTHDPRVALPPTSFEMLSHTEIFGNRVNAQLNYEMARYAMRLAEERNFFNDEILRARIVHFSSGFNEIGEYRSEIWVHVQTISGYEADLRFRGVMEGEKALIALDFNDSRFYHGGMVLRDATGHPSEYLNEFAWISR